MFLKGATANKSFLSRLLTPTTTRAFSRVAIQNFVKAEEATQAAQSEINNTTFNGSQYQKLQAYSQTYNKKKSEEAAAEAEWLSQLRSPQQKEGIYAKISEINEGDHDHLKEIKGKIAKLVK